MYIRLSEFGLLVVRRYDERELVFKIVKNWRECKKVTF